MSTDKTPLDANHADLKRLLSEFVAVINQAEQEWQEENRRCARKMLTMGLDFACIAKANWLTLEQLKEIENELLAASLAPQQVDAWLQAIKSKPHK